MNIKMRDFHVRAVSALKAEQKIYLLEITPSYFLRLILNTLLKENAWYYILL